MTLRSTLLLGAAILAFACSSCTHEYICHCNIKYSGQPGLPDSMVHEYPIRDKKDAARSACQGNSVHTTQNGITTDENCDLF